MNTPLLGLVTPSLNQRAYLAQCLDAVAALGPRVMHHVADGGSTDGTVELLNARGVHHASAPDGGLYPALNRGFGSVSGQLVGWLNCDDLLFPWVPGLLERALQDHPQAEVVYGDALEMRGGGLALNVTPPSAALGAFFRTGGVLPQPAVFFRPGLLRRLGGLDESYRLLADHDFFVRAHRAGVPFVHVAEPLAVQRMVGGQLMERHAAQAATERARIHKTHNLAWSPRAGRLLQASLHRWGLLALASGTAWPHTRGARVVAWEARSVAGALVRSTRGIPYARPGAGWSALFPTVPPVA